VLAVDHVADAPDGDAERHAGGDRVEVGEAQSLAPDVVGDA